VSADNASVYGRSWWAVVALSGVVVGVIGVVSLLIGSGVVNGSDGL